MAWKHTVALLALAPPRKVIVTALVYGLSLSVRFTSATGEEVEIPSLARTPIVMRDGAPVLRDGWPLRPLEPIALQLGRLTVSRERPTTPSCSAP